MVQPIRDLMTRNPVSMSGTASVHEAARAMRDTDIGDVIVIEHHQVCGIVTDRDIAVRIVAEDKDPATTTLAEICSHSLLTVTPTDSVEHGRATHAHPCHSPLASRRRRKGGRHCVARGFSCGAGSELGTR